MIQVYRTFPFADIISSEYYYLCGRAGNKITEYEVPHIGEIVQETWQTADRNAIEQCIQEAAHRRDYEIFGMDQEEFIISALRDEVHGFELTRAPMEEIYNATINYLMAHHICYMDYDGSIVNSPVGSGVW